MVFLNLDVSLLMLLTQDTVTGSTRVVHAHASSLDKTEGPFETAHLTTDKSCARHMNLLQQQPIGQVISRAMI